MHLSVIIPAYNEEKRIGTSLSRIYEFLTTKPYDYDVIVVDDGSTDRTVAVARQSGLAKDAKLRVVKNGINRGKGFSVKQGIINSSGEYVLLSDADLSTPIEEVDKLFGYIGKGYDMAIGSRGVGDSDVRIRQPWYREKMGRIYNFLVRLLLLEDFNDTQCGFKLLRGDVAREIAGLLKVEGFSFDVEMLYLAKMMGYKLIEVGVIWEDSPQSRVRILGSSLNMFLDLLRIKILHK